jgi:ribosomal protein S18 acetylase RimI-like enzyme
MTIDYRRMRAEEERAVLSLWSEVFATPDPGYQAARFATDPDARAHTFVAVAPDATVLAALHYRVTFRRDAGGLPRPVGEIDSVATRAEARRQGHATRLLLLALEALQEAGCDWSLLVATGEESRRLYERHGWRCYGEPWRRGTIGGANPSDDGRYAVRPFDPLRQPDGWEQIAAVDLAFNRGRPLTVVRDAAYWRGYAALRVGTWIATEGLVILGAFRKADDRRLCGYAMAEFYPSAFQVRDLAVLPEERDATLPLLTAVAAEARRRGIPPTARLYLPQEPSIDAALDRLFGPTLHAGQDWGHLMARPIAPHVTEWHLDAIFAAPGAVFSAIDLF